MLTPRLDNQVAPSHVSDFPRPPQGCVMGTAHREPAHLSPWSDTPNNPVKGQAERALLGWFKSLNQEVIARYVVSSDRLGSWRGGARLCHSSQCLRASISTSAEQCPHLQTQYSSGPVQGHTAVLFCQTWLGWRHPRVGPLGQPPLCALQAGNRCAQQPGQQRWGTSLAT